MPHERRPEEHYLQDAGFARTVSSCSISMKKSVSKAPATACWTATDRGSGPATAFAPKSRRMRRFRQFFDIEVVSIRLTDARFYHIDTCFCPLTDGFLMYHPPAFDYDSRIAIESRIPPHKRIIVDTMDAGNFACNAVNIGDRVILNKASDPLKARLMLAGFRVHEVELERVPESRRFGEVPDAQTDRAASLKHHARRRTPPLPNLAQGSAGPSVRGARDGCASRIREGQVFAMPAWIPGSYMIRDYARHVVARSRRNRRSRCCRHEARQEPLAGSRNRSRTDVDPRDFRARPERARCAPRCKPRVFQRHLRVSGGGRPGGGRLRSGH